VTGSRRPWLAPLVPLYRLAIGARELGLRAGIESVHRLRLPVISIGSLSAGGAGKTPLTIALARALNCALAQGGTDTGAKGMNLGPNIDVLSRGYGRTRREPARVDPNGTVAEFGDEPLEIARASGVPVYVAAERYQAGLLAERESGLKGHGFSRANAAGEKDEGALAPEGNLSGIHLLDDGFQHRRLHRDVDIVLFSRHDLNDRLLPAGNLREPLSALRRATILALPAEDADLAPELHWKGPVWRLRRRMEVPLVASPVLAFCGIARPDQFFSGLEAAGVSFAARIAFPDHHRYTQADLARLRSIEQSTRAAALLTTEKDRVRLDPFAAQLAEAIPLNCARLRIEIEDENAALDALLRSIAALG
jgi:tetraacyldisaccharide 4'-kinase